MVNNLRNALTKEENKAIRDELHEIDNRGGQSKRQKEKSRARFIGLLSTPDNR